MEVEQIGEHLRLQAPAVLTALLNEFSAVTDYRTLRDSLPRRLAHLLQCRSVLLYQHVGTTLQFVAGSFDDIPGWSTSLLAIAHINPIELNSDLPEARAWRTRHATTEPLEGLTPQLAAVPLIYRQRAIGVLVAYRKQMERASTIYEAGRPPARGATRSDAAYWTSDELPVLEAVASVVALLLENNRLLEHDSQRIHELSLLNRIANQLNFSIYEAERLYTIVKQRAREITAADRCELITPYALTEASSWITPALQALLLARFNQNRGPHLTPLIVERPGDVHTLEYLNHLSPNIKTFFAIPLLARESSLQRNGYRGGLLAGSLQERDIVQGNVVEEENSQAMPLYGSTDVSEAKVLAVIVGGYHRAYKLHREEILLLQVLANQAGAVLENMHLVTEVVEARNEARKLLRQVLDDQRLKELILESVPSGLITVDLARRITTYNRAAEAILGYLAFEALGQPLQKILQVSLPLASSSPEGAFPSQYATEHNIAAGSLREAALVAENLVTVDRHGQEVVLDVHRAPLYNDRRVHIGWLITFVDVTSVHHLEEEKRRLDRLVSLGEMAASVAHEVRNPLASIKTSMQMLKNDLGEYEQVPEDVQESVSVALKEVERLDAIVRDLLLFARPRQLHRVQCNLLDLSDHVLHMLQQQCTELGIEVHRVYHDVPLVYADMAQMEQVLFNLYMNAIQAMLDGGVLTISCQVVPASTITPKSIIQEKRSLYALNEPIGVYNDQQDWLELAVSDTGIGMATDQLEHIFQPFFTTKAHGIGLGLPITRRLVEDHRGHLSVQSQLGYGTTIAVRLPIEDVSS
ncbi:MAG: two-component system sensor histidine kinase NtrB [Ktedonobacteraceae bacterium]